MTLAEAIEQVRYISGQESSVGAYRDEVLTVMLNFANRMIWSKAAVTDKTRLLQGIGVVYTANSDSVEFLAAGASAHSVVHVASTETVGPPSPSNSHIPIYPEPVDDIELWANNSNRGFNPTGANDLRCVISGDKSIKLRPIPSTDVNLYILYVPAISDIAAGQELLNGKFEMYHDLVVYKACQLAALRNGGTGRSYESEYMMAWQAFSEALKGAVNTPKEVRHVQSHY